MSKGWKIVSIIISLVFITVLLPIVLMSNPYMQLPFGLDREGNVVSYFFNNLFMRQYMFWVAAVFIILFLIVILVVLFYPKTKTTFVLKEDKGTLTIDKKAIEGLVRTKVSDKEFVEGPKVSVKATKHRLLIKIKGRLKRTSALVGKTENLMAEIQQDVQRVLGSSEKIKVEVNYANFEQKETPENPRVE
ncbi:alkaline shock response membrane anchor protein AmaP [Enterococcus sp. RIT-PI-f]|jgi:multidrug efflux pump subunit AcrB|uniref:alkaline shock response membrane anchor protein AmaP n=1 Tax=Enterococcus sp. RIT-PI-f TaxID=1690244 RepID=UPI0006B9711C|nr:alkaline shock response membrane anchor protein AmaP [Enterococcus sp. RIT-PI-f]KPG68722.1 GapA [Enterococcus sp. RIT-PI-f]